MRHPRVRVQQAASFRLDEIYRYTASRFGAAQAARYVTRLFAAFDGIASHQTVSRPIPAAFGLQGYFFRHERHYVYWRELSNGDIGIVTILHERMHQMDRCQADFSVEDA